MSDLISRSKVISVLEQLAEHSLTGKMDISNAIYLLENQPTAYSVEEVVEELEELDVKSITRYKNGNFGDFNGVEYYIVSNVLDSDELVNIARSINVLPVSK